MAKNIMGLFQYEDDFITAARNLKDSGFNNLALMSPIPMHDAEKVLGLSKSPVRRFSLAGAIKARLLKPESLRFLAAVIKSSSY